MTKRLKIVFALAALLLAVFVLDGINLPEQTRVWREFTNAGHAPLFGVVAIAILLLARVLLRRDSEPIRQYLIAFVGATVLGLLTELGQIIGPRDASLMDFVNDVIGALAFLGVAATFDRSFGEQSWLRLPFKRSAIRLAFTALFLTAYIPFVILALAHLHRRAQFPVIMDFESYLDWQFVGWKEAKFDIVTTPPAWSGNTSRRVGSLLLLPARSSNFDIEYPYPRWRGYQSFSFEVFSAADSVYEIGFRIDDSRHNLEDWDRYGRRLTIMPGLNRYVIPLADVENAPAGRKMDMESIANIILFSSQLRQPLQLYLDNLRLE